MSIYIYLLQEEAAYKAILAKGKLRRAFQGWQAAQQHLQESRGHLAQVIQKVCNPGAAEIISTWQIMAQDSSRLTHGAKAIEGIRSKVRQQTAFKVNFARKACISKTSCTYLSVKSCLQLC